MQIRILDTKKKMGKAAAQTVVQLLVSAIKKKGQATFVLASAAPQIEFLECLMDTHRVDWTKTVMFHLDGYIGLPVEHPASFRAFLKDRFISKVHPGKTYLIQGDSLNPKTECRHLNPLISQYGIDVACIGIGENGHSVFNDPPADLTTEDPYAIVKLDETSRQQQVGEGWFAKLEEVPARAISMSVPEIMKARRIICTVPDARKAQAVKNTLEGDISPMVPASILRQHKDVFLFLDEPAALLLNSRKRVFTM